MRGASLLLPGVPLLLAAPTLAQGELERVRDLGSFPDARKLNLTIDFDGDLVRDFAVGEPTDGMGGLDAGRFRIISGKDGTELFVFHGSAGDQLGYSATTLGDQNRDGISDLVVGAPGANGGGGMVHLLSGADGSLLLSLPGNAATWPTWGEKVTSLGDVDADGRADLGVHTERAWMTVVSLGAGRSLYRVLAHRASDAGDVDGDGKDDIVFSRDGFYYTLGVATGVDGSELWSWWEAYSPSLARVDDWSGDGVPDLAYADEDKFRILDARDGTQIFQASHSAAWSVSGLFPCDDLDHDGRMDVIASMYGSSGGTAAYSSRTGQQLWHERRYGKPVAQIDDENGDRIRDLATRDDSGALHLLAVLPGLRLESPTLSASGSTPLAIHVDFASERAGTRYVVLASGSPRGSFFLNDFEIFLGLDSLLLRTLSGQRFPGTAGFQGQLNANGDAQASLAPLPRMAAWVGHEFWLAAVLYETAGVVPIGLTCSMPSPLVIAP